MIFQVITHFPQRYHSYLESGLPARAHQRGLFQILPLQLRDFADSSRKGRVDDMPYGGGPGMVLQVEPVDRALSSLSYRFPVVLFTPRGIRLTQKLVYRLLELSSGYTLICGYYEGVDERIAQYLSDYQISIGDFVLASGDMAALCFIETLIRLLPGYMGNRASQVEESGSIEGELLEYPQYTRPAQYRGWPVPEVLLSGDHGKIAAWRKKQSRMITERIRQSENIEEKNSKRE